MNATIRHAVHDTVPPIVDDKCHTLILGSMLSPKSTAARFYYAHPQNRFWRVLAAVLDSEYVTESDERTHLALSHGIALWDVIYSCDIVGASDSTIKNVVFNDIEGLLNAHQSITRIFTTGGTAYRLLQKYNKAVANKLIECAISLPSTSPQNCKISLEELICAYSAIAKN
ncbi:MAG: DNA-deoxyinosine glycosylase [Clostridiales bacterium]|nr:DNA-deoxyinosine glycosylase [Clostridiales bacterium]